MRLKLPLLLILLLGIYTSIHAQGNSNAGNHFPFVLFKKGQSTLTKSTKDSLAHYIKLLNDNRHIVIQLYGYASPSEEPNGSSISQARADACRSYIISQGIDEARVKAEGRGTENPVPGCSKDDISKMKTKAEKDSAEACDRRVEFQVIRFRYRR